MEKHIQKFRFKFKKRFGREEDVKRKGLGKPVKISKKYIIFINKKLPRYKKIKFFALTLVEITCKKNMKTCYIN